MNNSRKSPEKATVAGNKPLSVREERFCENIALGMKGGPAAKKAGYKGAAASLNVTASRLLRKANVIARIAEMRAKTSEKLEFSRETLAKHLFAAATTPVSEIDENSPLSQEVTTDKDGKRKVRGMGKTEAARLLCDMMGWKEPEQMVVETGPKTLQAVKERAKTMVSALDRVIRKGE